MRLINTLTLKLSEFYDENIPRYAILSHTWGTDEISYTQYEIMSGDSSIPTTSKIASCCRLAASQSWHWLWVDTCCIDKTSSAELTESINSMYRWYEKAEVCYAYLSDLSLKVSNEGTGGKLFRDSRWFTRGWTLQELLAPACVLFYDQG